MVDAGGRLRSSYDWSQVAVGTHSPEAYVCAHEAPNRWSSLRASCKAANRRALRCKARSRDITLRECTDILGVDICVTVDGFMEVVSEYECGETDSVFEMLC